MVMPPDELESMAVHLQTVSDHLTAAIEQLSQRSKDTALANQLFQLVMVRSCVRTAQRQLMELKPR